MEIPHKRSMRQHCALKHGILKEFLAEFLGTFVLVVSNILCYEIVFLCSLHNAFALEVASSLDILFMCWFQLSVELKLVFRNVPYPPL